MGTAQVVGRGAPLPQIIEQLFSVYSHLGGPIFLTISTPFPNSFQVATTLYLYKSLQEAHYMIEGSIQKTIMRKLYQKHHPTKPKYKKTHGRHDEDRLQCLFRILSKIWACVRQ